MQTVGILLVLVERPPRVVSWEVRGRKIVLY